MSHFWEEEAVVIIPLIRARITAHLQATHQGTTTAAKGQRRCFLKFARATISHSVAEADVGRGAAAEVELEGEEVEDGVGDGIEQLHTRWLKRIQSLYCSSNS